MGVKSGVRHSQVKEEHMELTIEAYKSPFTSHQRCTGKSTIKTLTTDSTLRTLFNHRDPQFRMSFC